MIDLNRLEKEKDLLKEQFLSAKPFPHIVIDDFLLDNHAEKLYKTAARPQRENKINDPVFCKNKYQFPEYEKISDNFEKLFDEITSNKFAKIISYITDDEIFFDKTFYGGGLHVGAKNSHLDMHADFNYHPKQKNWFRNINLLLYLNKDWKPEYGGSLKLKDARTGDKFEVEPLLNRLVIMHTRDYTLHGYETIHFPKNENRLAIAMYGYTLHETHISKPRTTMWVPESNLFKKVLAKLWIPAVAIKKKFLG